MWLHLLGPRCAVADLGTKSRPQSLSLLLLQLGAAVGAHAYWAPDQPQPAAGQLVCLLLHLELCAWDSAAVQMLVLVAAPAA